MAAQTYQLVISGNLAGQFVQNVLHYRMDDAGYPSRLQSAKGLVDGWLTDGKMDHFLDMCPTPYVVKSVKARCLTGGGGPEWIDASVASSPGTLGAGMAMSGAGPVIIWNTDGGPRRVGKTFIPGISPDNVDGGEISAVTIGFLLGMAALFRIAFNAVGGGTPSCVLCIPRSNDPSVRSLIVGAQVSKDVGQQRRRQLPV